MEEVLVKTHLIVTDVHDEYDMNWCGKIMDAKPKLKNGLPVFIIISSISRLELNTIDMARIEKCAKAVTRPRGRSAVTTDKAYIYLQEEDNKERLMGVLTHSHVKTYAPMYDKVGYSR